MLANSQVNYFCHEIKGIIFYTVSFSRCLACGKLLTADSQSKLRCVPNRMMVNHRGKVSYVHSR